MTRRHFSKRHASTLDMSNSLKYMEFSYFGDLPAELSGVRFSDDRPNAGYLAADIRVGSRVNLMRDGGQAGPKRMRAY